MGRHRTRALLACVAFGAAVMFGPVADAHASPQQDEAFYDAMQESGIILSPAAYSMARRACGLMWSGQSTPEDIAQGVQEGNPTWEPWQAAKFVAMSIVIYCPPAPGQVV